MANIYKRQKEGYERAHKRKKDIMWKVITVTAVALAVSILATGVSGLLYVDWEGIFNFDLGGIFGSGETDMGEDIEAPTIKPLEKDTIIYTGSNVSYKSLVKVSDNSGVYDLKFDDSNVDLNKTGIYEVKYTATDESGNVFEYTLTVHVKDAAYSRDILMKLVESKAKTELGYTRSEAAQKKLTKQQIVKDIYMYVKDPKAGANDANIKFNDAQSNTPNQLAQNGKKHREGWETDWIEEACRTLKMSRMVGDCYTYYAVSKAFFEYFEIENLGIERSPRSSISGTHYWNVVNIGTKSAPEWYLYDSTRLGGKFNGYGSGYADQNSCFMTEAKMNAYVTSKGSSEFYTLDKWEGFPKISTKDITKDINF